MIKEMIVNDITVYRYNDEKKKIYLVAFEVPFLRPPLAASTFYPRFVTTKIGSKKVGGGEYQKKFLRGEEFLRGTEGFLRTCSENVKRKRRVYI